MDKVTMIKELLKGAKTPEEQQKYQDELILAIREEETAKAQVALAQTKSSMGPGRIEVGAPAEYRGRKFKMEVAALTSSPKVPQPIREKWQAQPAKAERWAKMWIDLLETARRAPLSEIVTEKAGMDEGTTTEGGYLVATEDPAELFAYIREESVALKECRHIPMNTDSMYLTSENAKVSVAYTNEATDATETTPTVAQGTMSAKRMDGYVKVTNELLQDSKIPIVAWLTEQFMEAIGQKIDSTVFSGTGDPMSSIFTAAAGYSQVFATGSTNFSELLYADLVGCVSKLPVTRHRNAKWYAHRIICWNYLYKLLDSNGRPLFLYNPVEAVKYSLLGYPLVPLEGGGPYTSAVSTGFIAFGDLYQAVVIGDRLTSMSLFVDPYSLSRSNQTQLLLFTRWGFYFILPNAVSRIATPAS